jgi:hypothetical protein
MVIGWMLIQRDCMRHEDEIEWAKDLEVQMFPTGSDRISSGLWANGVYHRIREGPRKGSDGAQSARSRSFEAPKGDIDKHRGVRTAGPRSYSGLRALSLTKTEESMRLAEKCRSILEAVRRECGRRRRREDRKRGGRRVEGIAR